MTGPTRDRRGGPKRRPPRKRSPRPTPPNRTFGFWLIVLLVVLLGFQLLRLEQAPSHTISYSTFREQVEEGNLRELVIEERKVTGTLKSEQALPIVGSKQVQDVEQFYLELPFEDPRLLDFVYEHNPGLDVRGKIPGMNIWGHLLGWLPFILLLGIWLFFLRQMQGGGNRAFSFGKSKAKLVNADRPKVTFADVAGCDEAKMDLEEVIEFLKSPKKFQRLGGRIPKGVLLVGSPGTGKTLLAKAVAGEAGVPFFAMSGSDFVEMFVGVGASRVRDLFENGKKHAPCIIFIDEIDAVGRQRGAGLGGGHDEREQTLNQLLVEMDGFETNEGVILIAATNRPDVLDPALLRPGRFDRQITVDMPDIIGREAILKVHLRRVQADSDVDPRKIAQGTPGLSGADLANLVNEGALLAARRNHEQVMMEDLEDAKERVMLGPERRARVMPLEERERTAFHECGHAIVAAKLPDYDPVHKVTIIPRGMAMGVTWTLPKEDRYDITRDKAEQRITVALGGRAAEALIFPQVGAGASDDIKKATQVARRMVTAWGMSERLGPINFGGGQEPVFLGRDYHHQRDYSERTAIAIDEEVHRIMSGCFEQARAILEENEEALRRMSHALLERETLDGEDVARILEGRELDPLPEAPPESPPESPEDDEAKGDEPGEAATDEDDDRRPEGGVPTGEVPPPQPS